MATALQINNYRFDKPLTSENSGFSKWGIGKRGGRSYFVKEFLSPTYPVDDSVYTPEAKRDKVQLCNQFEEEKKRLYSAIRAASDGNLIAVEQFFRVGAKFYISTAAISGHIMSIAEIARLQFVDKLRLCCSAAHSIACLHKRSIVHSDIKPDNILVVRAPKPQAKIIDFDCSFFVDSAPRLGEELNGDFVYLSPEGFFHIAEIESKLSCKMDVFALGLVFHQFLTGELPLFDKEYQYAYESVLDDRPLKIGDIPNADCKEILSRMLKKEPDERPGIEEVFDVLHKELLQLLKRADCGELFEQAGDL